MARKAVTDDFKVFPERLSELMKERNVTQEELAHELGIKRQTVSLYKNGQSTPDAAQLKNISLFFGVSSDWLLGLSDVKSCDMDIRAICEKTGLSEKAVSIISQELNFSECSGCNSLADIFSDFIEDPIFLQIIGGFALACNAELVSPTSVFEKIMEYQQIHQKELDSIGAVVMPAGHTADLLLHQVEYRFGKLLNRQFILHTKQVEE